MTAPTARRAPRIALRGKELLFDRRGDKKNGDFYVDEPAGLLAIPMDASRIYRALPLASSR
jgi:hypothetical protein